MPFPDDDRDPADDLTEEEENAWSDPDALIDGVPARDWTAIVEYVTNNDTPEAHAITAARLKTDLAFAEFARPIIQLWKIPLIHRDQRDVDAGWAEIQRRAAALREAQSKLH